MKLTEEFISDLEKDYNCNIVSSINEDADQNTVITLKVTPLKPPSSISLEFPQALDLNMKLIESKVNELMHAHFHHNQYKPEEF